MPVTANTDFTPDNLDSNAGIEHDEQGPYVELYVVPELAMTVMDENQTLGPGEISTVRVYISKDVK